MFKLIEDHEIMRVYDQAIMIQFKCYYCGYIQRQIYRRRTPEQGNETIKQGNTMEYIGILILISLINYFRKDGRS